jgi:uncharacterized phage protein gp47/JayE
MSTPSLQSLFNSISNEFKTNFGITTENDLKRVLTAIASVEAGKLKLLYIAIEQAIKNVYPDKADSVEFGGTLERFGEIKLGRLPFVATQGKYTLTITGTTGATVNIGTQFVDKTTGYLYTATETITLSGTTGTLNVSSDLAGLDYLLTVSDELFTVNSITNISSKAVVASVVETPVDKETINDYREAVLRSFSLEPNGGSNSDYIFWALDVEGIRTVYPYTLNPYTVIIYAEATEAASEDGNGTAGTALLEALWKSDKTGVFEQDPDTTLSDYERGRRQLGLDNLNVVSVTPVVVNVTFTNLKDSSTSVDTSLISEIKSMLYKKRPFIAGVDNINERNDTLYYRDIVSAIENAIDSSNTYDDISITVAGQPLPYNFTDGNIPYLGTITYA